MKKHVIAAAVAAAVAVPAVAQVTISGVVDTGIVARDSGNSTANKYTGATSNVLTTSAIRMTTSEDLGGGLKAGFTIYDEFSLTTSRASGEAATSDTNTNTNQVFDAVDQFSIQVSGGFGAIDLGRFASLARSINGAGSVIGNIGLPGNYALNNDVTAVSSQVAAATATHRNSMRGLGNFANNSFAYTTPNFSGVTAQLYRSMSQRAADDAGEVDAFGIRYVQGPLTLGYSGIRQKITAAGAKRETTAVSAQYAASFATFGASTMTHDESSAVAGDDAKVNLVTARVPLGNGLSLIGGYHLFEDEAATSANKGTAVILGLTKDLSKRTTLYATYARVSNETNSTYSLSVMDTGVVTGGNDPKAMAVGVRHSF